MNKEAQTTKILKLLKQDGSVTNAQLNRICFRYAARVHELRKEGHIILTERLHDGLFRFTYRGHRDDEVAPQPQPIVPIKPRQLSLV